MIGPDPRARRSQLLKNRVQSVCKAPVLERQQSPPQDKRSRVMFIYNVRSFLRKYWLGPGNNSAVVRRVLSKRQNWVEVGQGDKTHFRWHQSHRGFKYELLSSGYSKEMVNHFEHHPEVSDKGKLIRNLNHYCETKKTNMFDITPPTFVIDFSDLFCDRFLADFLMYYTKHHPRLSDPNRTRMEYLSYFKNLVSGTGEKQKPLSNKYCVYNMSKNFVDQKNSYLWLLKPTSLNRGRGVRVFSELQTLKDYLKEYMQGFTEKVGKEAKDQNYIKTDAFVIQKYIERPMLISERKFDIRTWVLVDHLYNLYFFEEGYVRMSSEKFDSSTGSINNPLIHLTNNAVQKHGTNYCKFESGNQLSFPVLEKYMKEHYDSAIGQLPCDGTLDNRDVFFERHIKRKMKDIVVTTMTAAKDRLNPQDRKHCMEIFGYDFLIDESLNVWLIEINTNPCIEESSTLLKELIPRMLDDAFKLTIDVLFPKWNYTSDIGRVKIIEYKIPSRTTLPQIYRVTGHADNRNLWELQCNIQPRHSK